MVENAVLYSKFYLRFAKNSVFDNVTLLNFQVRKSSKNCRLVVKILLNKVIFGME